MNRTSGQAGKSFRNILVKSIKLRKEQKKAIMGSGIQVPYLYVCSLTVLLGMSGSRVNLLESAIDEIITLDRNRCSNPVESEYMSKSSTKTTLADKKKKGELLRQLVNFLYFLDFVQLYVIRLLVHRGNLE